MVIISKKKIRIRVVGCVYVCVCVGRGEGA